MNIEEILLSIRAIMMGTAIGIGFLALTGSPDTFMMYSFIVCLFVGFLAGFWLGRRIYDHNQ